MQTRTTSSLLGVWKRLSLETPDAPADTTTFVCWVQSEWFYADIRIPAYRADLRSGRSLAALSDDELLDLARQQGFAGITDVNDNIVQWHRHIDYQPYRGARDIGRLEDQGDVMIEHGVDEPYREVWQRVDTGGAGSLTLRLLTETDSSTGIVTPRRGLFVAVGEWCILVRDRISILPPAPALIHLLKKTPRSHWPVLLDLEISQGRRSTDGWIIERSTLPFVEGQEVVLHRQGDSLRQKASPDGAVYRTFSVLQASPGALERWTAAD